METIANSQFFRTAFDEWKNRFFQRYPEGPAFEAVIKTSLGSENYYIQMAGGRCWIEGGSSAAVMQGAGLFEVACSSGHQADFLGGHRADFPCRWLYLKGDFDGDDLCNRVLQLGYNGVIVPHYPSNPRAFQELGVEIILAPAQPDATPFDSDWKPELGNLEGVKAIYWKGTYAENSYLYHPKARDELMIDLALREVRALEEAIDGRSALVYELDPQAPVHWIPELMDAVGENTLISFSTLNGCATESHHDYHPLWKVLRELPDTSATRLLPILNAGGVGQGEGLWPVIPLDSIDFAIAHMRRQPFGGVVALTRHLPLPGTFLDGALWTLGHALWGSLPPRLLLETWCKAYHPGLASLELLGDIWKASRRLSGLRAEKERTTDACRSLSESLISELKRLQELAQTIPDSHMPSIKEYYTYFARDARRLVLHFLQTHHAPMANVLNGDDLQEAFWTAIQQSGGQGFSTGAKVSLLESPQMGSEGSAMRQIYAEVTSKNYT